MEGTWWIPGERDLGQRGVLEFTADRFNLTLEGGLIERPKPGPGATPVGWEEVTVPVIHGEMDDQIVSLLDCSGSVPTHDIGLVTAQNWWPRLMVLDGHADQATRFDRLIMSTEHLDEWAGTPTIERELDHDAGVATAVAVRAERQVLEEVDVQDVGRVSVVAFPTYEIRRLNASVALAARVVVEPAAALSVDVCLETAELVRSFLRLCIGTQTAITELHVREVGSSRSMGLVYRSIAFGGKSSSQQKRHDMFAARPDLPGGLGRALESWARQLSRHDQAWFRLCATDFVKLTNVDETFTAYCQALETLHSGDFPCTVLADDERDERIKRALTALPVDLVGWAEPLLEASSPPVFRHRVIEMVQAVGPIGELFTGGDVGEFAARVSATRNPLTHPRAKRSRKFIADQDLRFEFGRALHLVGVAYLLHAVGVPVDDIAERFARSSSVQMVIARLRAERGDGSRWDEPEEAPGDT